MLFQKHVMCILSAGLLFFSVFACAQDIKPEDSIVADAMLKELSAINGKYIWNNEQKAYIYSEKQYIEEILSNKETEFVIKTLVGCLDNPELSNSTINNQRVALGMICYEALSQTAYYEDTTKEGDVAKYWPGHVLPTATPEELRRAKRAWEKVVDSKAYILF